MFFFLFLSLDVQTLSYLTGFEMSKSAAQLLYCAFVEASSWIVEYIAAIDGAAAYFQYL